MKKSLAILAMAFMLSSCVEATIGGIGAGVFFVERTKSFKASVKDTAIQAAIARKYHTSKHKAALKKIQIDAEEGRVLLRGRVKKQADAVNAIKLAWKVKNVKEVINEMKVGNKGKSLLKDIFIATQVKTKLIFDKNVKAINYNVEVEDGIVYLLGNARSKSELRRAAIISAKVKGVKRVVSHVRVKR